MNPLDIDAICAEVLADRRRTDAVPLPPLPLTFTNPRQPTSAAALTPDEQRQAVAVGQDGIGRRLAPDDVFGEDAQEEGLYKPELWDVRDATGALAFRVWMYGVDNGTVFRGDTIEVVAGCAQGGLESRHPGLVDALIAAREAIPDALLPPQPFVKFLG